MSNNISSIHFKKSTNFQVYHNDKIRPNYAIGGEILCNKSSDDAVKLRDEIIEKAKLNYQKNNKSRNKNFQTTNYLWSAVVNIRDDVKTDDAMKQLEELADYFHKMYKFQCFQISIHRDEGYIGDDGEKHINHHAHLEFVTLDENNGRQVFKMRDFDKEKLRKIQDDTAEILNMERGKPGAKRIEPRKYGALKEQVKAENKALKQDLEQVKAENKALKEKIQTLTQKQISSDWEQIRDEMKKEKIYTADDYRKLQKAKKDELEKAKSQGVTKEDHEQALAQLRAQLEKAKDDELKAKDEKIEKLEKAKIDEYVKSDEMEKSNEELLESYLARADTLENAKTQIKLISIARNFDDIALNSAKNTIIKLREELKKSAPNSQNKDLKADNDTLTLENQRLKSELLYIKQFLEINNLVDKIKSFFNNIGKKLSMEFEEPKSQELNHAEPSQEIQLTPKADIQRNTGNQNKGNRGRW